MKYNTFENKSVRWVACDTETYTYIDGIKVSESELIRLGKSKSQSWFKEHCSVKAYAWLFSDGLHFAYLESFDEYVDFCCDHKIKSVWWYNAKFDFAIIDYALLTEGWTSDEEAEKKDKTFNSLHNEMGARYSLKLHKEYKGKGRGKDRHARIHTWTNYDFCNIFGGGLAKCLESFDVRDADGKPIRKLKMDYQGENDSQNADAMAYMEVDVKGLYYLVKKASEFLEKECGYSLTGNKPDIITAGGLAKRQLLQCMYGLQTKQDNLKKFKREHKMDIEIDRCIREHFLYRGGITFVNPFKQNLNITQKIYKYDINSMYPAQMKKMYDLYGRPRSMSIAQYKALKDKGKYQLILEIDMMMGQLKENMLGMFYDPHLKKFTDSPHIMPDQKSMFMFLEEFNEYRKYWYDLEYHIKRCIIIRKRKVKGYAKYVDKFYKMKNEGKAKKNPVMKAFGKLCLNSSYGKLSERAVRLKTHRELTDMDYVHLVSDGEETDEKSLMSVIQGALVTSMARVTLLKFIREICGNVKENLIYCDTDSVHSLSTFADTDDFELGKMKLEAVADYGKYLAPKTYIDGTLTNDKYEFEVHSKGVPTNIIKRLIDGRPLEQVDSIFAVGSKFICLAGMNVSGGKALIPIPKTICKVENTIMRNEDGEEIFVPELEEKIFE